MSSGLKILLRQVQRGHYTGISISLTSMEGGPVEYVLGRARDDQRFLAGAGVQRLANILLHPDLYDLPVLSCDDMPGFADDL